MKNILIPTDFSDNSWNALQYAVSLFRKEECNFYLLHVSSYEVAASGVSVRTVSKTFVDRKQTVGDQFRHLSLKIRQLPHNEKHQFFFRKEHIYLVDSIRKTVEEKSINYIVIGTKGASGLKEKLIGSNTGDIITRVKCPTIVVPEQAKHSRVSEIVFPTDYNIRYNSKILNTLSEILELTKSDFNALIISKSQKVLTEQQVKNKELLKDALTKFEPSFHFSLDQELEEGVQYFVDRRNADMIAMVAKNLNFFQRILFHPTIEMISYHTKVPFLVLHE